MDGFGKRLLDFRRKAGMSQEDLAEKLGISRQTLSKWEQGQSEPGVEMILLLCSIFQVTPNELLGTETGRGQTGNDRRSMEQRMHVTVFDVFMLLLLIAGVILYVVYLSVPYLDMLVGFMGLGMVLASIVYFPVKAIRAAARRHKRKQ